MNHNTLSHHNKFRVRTQACWCAFYGVSNTYLCYPWQHILRKTEFI